MKFNRYTLNTENVREPLRGEITYFRNGEPFKEEFYINAGEKRFESYIDGFLDGSQADGPAAFSFETLCGVKMESEREISVSTGFTLEKVLPERLEIRNEHVAAGMSLRYGGALESFVPLEGNVSAVKLGRRVYVGRNMKEKMPGSECVSERVNLLNNHDTGRLVQQSFYGTSAYPYVRGEFMGKSWPYNPVMGGDRCGNRSKIVDARKKNCSVYVKCRPMDWGKNGSATPGYMEALYRLNDGVLAVENRFTDFSGYDNPECTQEMPAFYAIEPLSALVYYGGDRPWTGGPLTVKENLPFWADRDAREDSSECWWMFANGEGYGIGLFVPGINTAIAGIYRSGEEIKGEPAQADPTAYVAPIKRIRLETGKPVAYRYAVAQGTAEELRRIFGKLNMEYGSLL